MDWLAERTLRGMTKRRANIDAVCAAALAGGEHGVLVETGVLTEAASVSPEVPYGEVHYRRMPEGVKGVNLQLVIMDEAGAT